MKNLIIAISAVVLTGNIYAQGCINPPVVSITASDTAVCNGQSLTLTAVGAPTIIWNNGVVNAAPFIPTNTQTYTAIGIDANGCSDTASITIEVKALPNIEIEIDKTLACQGDSVFLNAINGTSYQWLNPTGLSNNSWFKPTVLGVNVFVVQGTGANGCVKNSQVVVLLKESPVPPSLNTNAVSTCLNVPFTNQIVASTNNLRVFWYNELNLDSVRSESDALTVPYNAILDKDFYARTYLAGCYSTPVSANVKVHELPALNAGEDLKVAAGFTGNLNATVSPNTNIVWRPSTNLINPFSPTTGFQALNSITYTITAENEFGCISIDELKIDVETKLNIAGAISPNGDGNNDTWKIFPIDGVKECTVKLFDGFGRELVNTTSYQNDWNGTYEGKQLPDGDYYYHIKCDGFEEKGTLILIR